MAEFTGSLECPRTRLTQEAGSGRYLGGARGGVLRSEGGSGGIGSWG